ncbi:MAG: hypothetical protein ACI97A_001665 [Planctomycetota bacterium]|jgi:hypothetical protein
MTKNDRSNDYLWDPESEPDREIEKLEEALLPLRSNSKNPVTGSPPAAAHDFSGARTPFGGSPSRAKGVLVAAGIAILMIGVWQFFLSPKNTTEVPSPNEKENAAAPSPGLKNPRGSLELIVSSTNRRLMIDEVIEPKEDENLVLDTMGEIAVNAGSRLRIQRLEQDRTRLFLDYGQIHALIYLNVKPRFFEVGTPATTCVDLGCEYTLKVDKDGVANVSVTSGQVAFIDGGREIFVPDGATCRADKVRGAGTPRFRATPQAMSKKLDRFDQSEEGERSALATELLQDIATEQDWRHTLIAWHFLQDKSPGVFNPAKAWLDLHFVKPDSIRNDQDRSLTEVEIEAWKNALKANW